MQSKQIGTLDLVHVLNIGQKLFNDRKKLHAAPQVKIVAPSGRYFPFFLLLL